MDRAKVKRTAVFVGAGILGLVLVVGCYRAGQGPVVNWTSLGLGAGAAAPDQFATAKAVFGRNCAQCHSIDGSRAPSARSGENMKGPDLARAGADPGHTRQWLMDTIRDPQAQDRRSRMPRFEGKLSEGDLLALADYLASLKGN